MHFPRGEKCACSVSVNRNMSLESDVTSHFFLRREKGGSLWRVLMCLFSLSVIDLGSASGCRGP